MDLWSKVDQSSCPISLLLGAKAEGLPLSDVALERIRIASTDEESDEETIDELEEGETDDNPSYPLFNEDGLKRALAPAGDMSKLKPPSDWKVDEITCGKMKKRDWCFAVFKLPIPTFKPTLMHYMTYQWEVCPKTKRIHLQGYVEFKTAQTFASMKDIFHPTACLGGRWGTRDQARDYCHKPKSRFLASDKPIEFGTWRVQGVRSDIVKLRDAVLDGLTSYDLMTNEDEKLVQGFATHQKFVDRLAVEHNTKGGDIRDIEVFYSKDKKAYTDWNIEDLYFVDGNLCDWSGYTNQATIVVFADDIVESKVDVTRHNNLVNGICLSKSFTRLLRGTPQRLKISYSYVPAAFIYVLVIDPVGIIDRVAQQLDWTML